MLTIKDRTFRVTNATISATVHSDEHAYRTYGQEFGKLYRNHWSIWIETEERLFNGQSWQPTAMCQILFLQMTHWTELVKQRITWTTTYDEKTRQEFGVLHVVESADARNGEIVFSDLVGDTMDMKWRSECDVFLEDYYTNLPLRIDTKIQFGGVGVFAPNLEEATALLRKYYDPKDYTPFLPYGYERWTHDSVRFIPKILKP